MSFVYLLGSQVEFSKLCLSLFEFLSFKVVLILANSVDPDEIQQNAAFHLGLHLLPPYPYRDFQYTKSKWQISAQNVLIPNTSNDEYDLMFKMHECSIKKSCLTLSGTKNPNLVLWQTEKFQMKCHMMWHFIKVVDSLVTQNRSSEKEIQFFWGNYNNT